MRIGNRWFSPKLWAVLLYLTVLSCMLWLGNWQLERAALKTAMQQAADDARQAEALPLEAIDDIVLAAASYQRVLLRGQYDASRQFLWDNRTHNAQAGFEVIVPLQLEDGRWVLVNRGWVAPGASRQQLPDVSLPADSGNQPVSLEGFLTRPSKGFASGHALPAEGPWPRLLQYFDYPAISKALGAPIVPAVVQVQSLDTGGEAGDALASRPEWLTANWQPAASGPAKHYSYAFQWFAMASALTVLFVLVNTRKAPPARSER
jgi:surfeit locus 1 family protein